MRALRLSASRLICLSFLWHLGWIEAALPTHLGLGRGRVSSPAASSLTRIEPRAQTTKARASLSLREHAAYEDTLPLPSRSLTAPRVLSTACATAVTLYCVILIAGAARVGAGPDCGR